jgi:hypothetical protein
MNQISTTYIASPEALLATMREFTQNDRNLSIRGVAKLCGVDDMSIIRSADFHSAKLGQKLMAAGFEASACADLGFPPQAVWLCIEYFAYESKAAAPGAKQLARTFGSYGVLKVMEELAPVSESVYERELPPVRDTIEWVDCAERINLLDDPILRSALTQSLYEDLGCANEARLLAEGEERHVPAAVRCRELGYTLSPGQDSLLGKYVKRHIEPSGQAPHGRYQINVYRASAQLDEVIESFFR